MERTVYAAIVDPETGGSGWAGADIDESTGDATVIISSMLKQPWRVQFVLPDDSIQSILIDPGEDLALTPETESWVATRLNSGSYELDVKGVRSNYPAGVS